MENKSGRSSKVSDRSTPSSRISRLGSAVGFILDRIGAVQANLGAIHAGTRDSIEAIHADIHVGAVHADIGVVSAAYKRSNLCTCITVSRTPRVSTIEIYYVH